MKYSLLKTVLFFLIVGGINFPCSAQAAGASLYLAPSTGTKVIGSKFTVAVKVNSGGQEINSGEGVISYDTNLLEAVSVSKSGSVFVFWPVEPNISGSTISFGGGRPNPYNGTAGHIITITFKAKKIGGAQVRFTSGAVLAHDGKGTNILVSMGSGSYTISPQVTAPKKESPKKEEARPEPEYNKPGITSPTHPDQNAWYNKNKIQYKWELPDGVTDVSIKFDLEPLSNPGSVSDGSFAEKEYEAIKDGIWYLHLKFKDTRRWGTIAHYRTMIDTMPPLPFEIEVKKLELGEWPELHFETKDEGSGLKQYKVIIDSLKEKVHVVEPDKKLFQVSDLEAGEHTAIVIAVDMAGNETLSKADFAIEPIEAPVITDYAAEIKASDKFYMSGTALSNIAINVFIEQDNKIIATDTTQSDNNGNWFYLKKEGLANGRYVAWVEAVNDKGIKSEYSNKVSFLVSPPVFASFGIFVINYFTVFVSLLFLIIVIILLILFLVGLIRKKLKKETVEIEDVVRKNLDNLRKMINKELKEIDKAAGKPDYVVERKKAEEHLKKNIKEVEKKILKEIKDVEEILK